MNTTDLEEITFWMNTDILVANETNVSHAEAYYVRRNLAIYTRHVSLRRWDLGDKDGQSMWQRSEMQ
jgi:hypothetical protein